MTKIYFILPSTILNCEADNDNHDDDCNSGISSLFPSFNDDHYI